MNDATSSDGIGDIVNLLAAPLAGGLKVVDQVWRGTEELIRTIEKLNRTLDSLNETSTRVNGLLEEIEEPVRAAIPQLTRTIRAADEITQLLEGPVRAAAPNIERLATGLSQPGVAALPEQLGEAVGLLRDMAGRMAPLTLFAESASGLFGGLGRSTSATAAPKLNSESTGELSPPPTKNAPAKKKPAKKAPAKKTAATKKPTKKAATEKPTKKTSASGRLKT